jgi:uncharacterized protein YukE
MAQQFGVTPSDLRATSQHLKDASDRMKDVLSTLREGLTEVGAVWGDDRIGDQFANGDGGFIAQQAWVDSSVEAKTGLLDDYSEGLKRAADASEQYDQA